MRAASSTVTRAPPLRCSRSARTRRSPARRPLTYTDAPRWTAVVSMRWFRMAAIPALATDWSCTTRTRSTTTSSISISSEWWRSNGSSRTYCALRAQPTRSLSQTRLSNWLERTAEKRSAVGFNSGLRTGQIRAAPCGARACLASPPGEPNRRRRVGYCLPSSTWASRSPRPTGVSGRRTAGSCTGLTWHGLSCGSRWSTTAMPSTSAAKPRTRLELMIYNAGDGSSFGRPPGTSDVSIASRRSCGWRSSAAAA